jgi:hypothetical protein
MKAHKLVYFLAVTVLVACTPVITPSINKATATDAPTATLATAVTPPTESPQATASWTALAVTPSASVVPATATHPTNSPTPKQSPSPTATTEQNPTTTPTDSAGAQFLLASPDGRYVAKLFDEFHHPSGKQTIEVLNSHGKLVWSIPYQGQMPTGDPHPSLSLYRWSRDSSVLYFYYGYGYDGFPTFFKGNNLQGLNVISGKISTIVSGCCIDFVDSPDGTLLAYTQRARLGIRNLATGLTVTATIQPKTIIESGQIHWSPSGNGIVFRVMLDTDENARFMYLNVKTMNQKNLFDHFAEDYEFDGWTADENPSFRKGDNTIIVIDTDTGVVQPIGTVTPTPQE